MGHMKDLMITIYGGGNEAVEAAKQIAGLSEIVPHDDEPEWISVKDHLPEPDSMGNPVAVLVCMPDGEVCIAFCDNDEYGVRWQCQSTKKPTHWMPLPEPPAVRS